MEFNLNEKISAVAPAADEAIKEAASLHTTLPGYQPTPLTSLPGLAERLGLEALYVKDEGFRFGLKAFKSLGASYAIFKLLEKKSGKKQLAPQEFLSEKGKDVASDVSFSCATDGNHGRAVAWVSRLLSRPAVIYMPEGTAEARIRAIESESAKVIVVDGDYDLAVRTADSDAQKYGRQIISDTGYEGYTEIPRFIQQGYFTLFREVSEQIQNSKLQSPDLVLIQSGVGAFAAAAASYFAKPEGNPKLISVEAANSDCLRRSAFSPDGKAVTYSSDESTIMAGLNCGTPSSTAWQLIKQRFSGFISLEDHWAREAMRTFASHGIVSGESGSAGLAALLAINEEKTDFFSAVHGLPSKPRVLIINTEADTDPANYQKVIAG